MFPSWYRPHYSYDWRETLNRVAKTYKVAPEDILGRSRQRHITDARWVFIKALRAKGRLSFPRIGQIVNRDHTTVMHACQNFKDRASFRQEMHTALQEALR
jgi:chromosomal replication initiator protein